MRRRAKYLVPASQKTRRSSHRLTAAEVADLVQSYVRGHSPTKIGRRLKVSVDNVRYHVKKAGVWAGGRRDPILAERFWARVDMTAGPDGCWLWTGTRFPNGYGCIGIAGRSTGAHRVAYEMANGSIPDGLTLDHTCTNKRCVNPAHLEPCTAIENSQRYHARVGHKTTLKR